MNTENTQQPQADEVQFDSAKVERINNVISEYLGIAPQDIKDGQTLEELGADSLDAVEIVMGLEDEFEIEIPDEKAENWKTVRDIYSHFHPSSEV